MSAYLYRARDEHGALLYIGATTRPKQRQAYHACRAPWASLAREQLEWVEFPDMQAALKAEKEEIAMHRPPFNKAANPDKMRCNIKEPVRVNLLVDRETRKEWKLAALAMGLPLAALIEKAVREYIKQEHAKD